MSNFEMQRFEIETMLKKSGLSPEQLAERAAIAPSTFRRYWRGHSQASRLVMQSLRQAAMVYEPGLTGISTMKMKGDEPIGLRYVPVISFAQAGNAASYEEIPRSWDKRVPTDSVDLCAFGVEIKGDSMEPMFKEGSIAIVRPGLKASNGDLVIANLKERGTVFKLLHVLNRTTFNLTSYNSTYPPIMAKEKDFHWIYPVESVTKKLL